MISGAPNATQALEWCAQRQIVGELAPSVRLRYEGGGVWSFVVDVPREASKLLAISYVLVTTFLDFDDEHHFKGCLSWIAERGIWSESHERVGARLAEGLWPGTGAHPLGDSPARLFDDKDIVGAQAFTVLALLFGWDAFLVPASGGYFAFMHHEGQVFFIARNFEILSDLRSRFERWGPRDGAPPYLETGAG